jgi:hypothetical protein
MTLCCVLCAARSQETDVYMFGMMVYELFSGDVPYRELTNEEVIVRKSRQELPPRVPCPPAVWELFLACTRAEPSARPTMLDVSQTLLDELARAEAVGPAEHQRQQAAAAPAPARRPGVSEYDQYTIAPGAAAAASANGAPPAQQHQQQQQQQQPQQQQQQQPRFLAYVSVDWMER